jgi:antitoxin ParD1/3/4
LRPIPIIGIFVKTLKIMAKNTSILLGDYFENFINQQVKSGEFATASEVMRAALRLFEYEQSKRAELVKELKKGEKSGFVKDFDRAVFLENIHEKHLTE